MNRYLAALIVIWWAGAAIASLALFIPVYNYYLVTGIMGWVIVAVATSMIFFEMKRIKGEDKKRDELKS